ncbi:MAG: cytochrome c oxidase subunit 3 family protein [Bacteroidota bacterium]
MESNAHTHVHRDDQASKLGMWLFIFTEILLFGGLFIVYSIYRYMHQTAFHLAGEELNDVIGTINTVILLVSSMTIAMSVTAIQKGNTKLVLRLIAITVILGIVFLVNKYFEWNVKFEHGLYPSSKFVQALGAGDTLFFSLYFLMTGLHALHIIVGLTVLVWVAVYIKKGRVRPDKYAFLENGALYWHLIDLIWIFLFPLFYLIH